MIVFAIDQTIELVVATAIGRGGAAESVGRIEQGHRNIGDARLARILHAIVIDIEPHEIADAEVLHLHAHTRWLGR